MSKKYYIVRTNLRSQFYLGHGYNSEVFKKYNQITVKQSKFLESETLFFDSKEAAEDAVGYYLATECMNPKYYGLVNIEVAEDKIPVDLTKVTLRFEHRPTGDYLGCIDCYLSTDSYNKWVTKNR